MTTTRTVRRWQTEALALLTTIPAPAAALLPALVLASLSGCSSHTPKEFASNDRVSPTVIANLAKASEAPRFRRGMMRKRTPGGINHMEMDGGRGVDGTLEYFGGPVISNVVVHEIFWGTTGFDATYQANIGGFYAAILQSSWWSWLVEYNTAGLNGTDNAPGSNQIIGPGTFGGSVIITPANLSTTLAPSDVATEIEAQMKAGVIPPLEFDSAGNVNSLYMVDFPAAITINDMGSVSCSDFCGEHTSFQMNVKGVMVNVPFALLPDHYLGPCTSGCGSLTPFENACSTASHELAEAVTDTAVGATFDLGRPLGWFDAVFSPGVASGEIGDLCVGEEGVAAGYTVQRLWSNLNNGCIEAAPPCNGTTQPPYCTPCTAADDGVGCNGTTPICETETTSPRVGQCVECNATTACPSGATAFCATSGADVDSCRGCTASDCTGATPICETSGAQVGQCVACDATHTAACTGLTAICDTTEFACVGCLTSATCATSTPICDSSTQLCRACASAADCGAAACETLASSPKFGECVPCTTNRDCAGSTIGPVCTAGACVAGAVADDAGSDGGGDQGDDAGSGSGSDSGGGDVTISRPHLVGPTTSSGCIVGKGTTDAPWELGLVLVLGVPILRRRRARS